MKLTKRQLQRIINEEKRKLVKEGSWIPSDEEYDAADMYVMSDCFSVLELVSRLMGSDNDLYGDANMEMFLMECIEWIHREGLKKGQFKKSDYV